MVLTRRCFILQFHQTTVWADIANNMFEQTQLQKSTNNLYKIVTQMQIIVS